MLFRNVVGNGRDNEPDDVLNAKRVLTRLDRYWPPRHGLNGIIDRQLDEAIKGFQEDNDLRVDGWMRPGGSTQRRLEESLGARWQTVADRQAEQPRLRLDLPDWTPRLTDPRTGNDLLAPDGKPFTLSCRALGNCSIRHSALAKAIRGA
jgi:Putative peptidoglycan binding domain